MSSCRDRLCLRHSQGTWHTTCDFKCNGDTPTHEDLTKNKERTSENRGLSRLFSSFLKRPKSQVSEEEGKEVESAKEKGEGGQKEIELGASLDEEIILKAPIAAPEPELKTDPSLDLHSLSSAETQVRGCD